MRLFSPTPVPWTSRTTRNSYKSRTKNVIYQQILSNIRNFVFYTLWYSYEHSGFQWEGPPRPINPHNRSALQWIEDIILFLMDVFRHLLSDRNIDQHTGHVQIVFFWYINSWTLETSQPLSTRFCSLARQDLFPFLRSSDKWVDNIIRVIYLKPNNRNAIRPAF